MCYVVCGRLDGFWELNLRLYDIAAGILILEEAGGRLSNFSGDRHPIGDELVASNALIHTDLVTLLSGVDKP